MGNHRRVVITGLGIISPLGNSLARLSESLQEGRSGVVPLTLIPPLADRLCFGGECQEFTGKIDNFEPLTKDLKKAIRKALKVMCRETMMAVACAQQALNNAKVVSDQVDPERCGVVFGSDYMLSPPEDFVDGMVKCGAHDGQFSYADWGGTGLGEMNPLWMLKYLPNMPGSHIAILNDFRGPNNSLTMREASGLLAIREAMQTIQRGHADLILAGATGTRIHAFKSIHAAQTEQLASTEFSPTEASRPFDARRTGMVVGEGSGAVVLEELESAKARGATIYGELLGSGSSLAIGAGQQPDCKQALANAARAALAEAQRDGASLGHINAHGLATTPSDIEESAALHEVLGDAADSIPTVAPKSYFGNLGAASGVVELAASLVALGQQRLFGTLNYSAPDPLCRLNLSAEPGQPSGASVLKLSVTPQGQAAALVVDTGVLST